MPVVKKATKMGFWLLSYDTVNVDLTGVLVLAYGLRIILRLWVRITLRRRGGGVHGKAQ